MPAIRIFLVALALCAALPSAQAETALRIATWNIAHLKESDPERGEDDYTRLAEYAAQLDADIVALQEIENDVPLRKIFGTEYDFYVSSRRAGFPQRVGFAVRHGTPVAGAPREIEHLALPGDHLRYGMDLTVQAEGTVLRILAVHLKSGCFDAPLSDVGDACPKLRLQAPILESWIDARARAGEPLIVLGDFNRRFDNEASEKDGDWLWPILSDGDPAAQSLVRATRFRTSACYDYKYPAYIDHIVLDQKAASWVVAGSFRQIVYDAPFSERKKLSDHCPISIDIKVPDPTS